MSCEPVDIPSKAGDAPIPASTWRFVVGVALLGAAVMVATAGAVVVLFRTVPALLE